MACSKEEHHTHPHPQPTQAKNSRLPPENTIYRYPILLATKALKPIRPRKGSVLMLTDRLCVKYGSRIHSSEASAMRFIAQNTSIPIPRVYCAFTHKDRTYIVMEKIQGDKMGAGWLKRMIQEMRGLQRPEDIGVASVDGGSLFDCRVAGPCLRFGPFRSISDFHLHLREGMRFDPRLGSGVQDLIKRHAGHWPIVFTHGDLSSLNILVRGDEVVGIVDWETAGWYPEYWEYITVCQVNPQNSFWINEIDRFLDPMPEELAMDRIRQKYFGGITF